MTKQFSEGDNYKWAVLVTVAIGSFMASLDISVLQACLPRLSQVFHTDSAVITWVSVGYLLSGLALMLTLAKIGDAWGRRKMYVLGLALYTLGLVICSVSQNISQLLAARIIQGIGGAAVVSLSSAIVVAVFPSRQRGAALGILLAVASVGLVIGPVLGGVIADMIGWRGLFYTRLPIGLIGIAMALLVIEEQREEGAKFRLDLGGALTLVGGMTCLLLFFTMGMRWGLASRSSLLLLFSSVVLLTAFILFELKAPQPIVELHLFKDRTFAWAMVALVLQATAFSSPIFLIPFYLADGMGYSTSMVGVFLALTAVPFVVIYPLSGRLSDRIGATFLSALGAAVTCVGIYLTSRLDGSSTGLYIGLIMLLFGSGAGIFNPPNNSAVLGSVPKSRLGTASGMVATARQLGGSFSFALSGSLLAERALHHAQILSRSHVDKAVIRRMSAIYSFHDILMLAAIVSCVGIAAALRASKSSRFW
jgi:EmrB/QacA subfamily drug resistance transporter